MRLTSAALSLGMWALGLHAPRVAAQQFTGVPAVDSASVARGAWTAAMRASRARDTAAARAAVERAASAWPTQPAYVWSRAVLAAAARDTITVQRALRDYAALGLGRPLKDTIFDPFRPLPWFGELAGVHASLGAPLARGRVVRTLSDSTLWPEGVDVDPRTGNVYVASVRHGTVIDALPDGRERQLWPAPHEPAIGAALAVRLDPSGGRLWATVSALPQWLGYRAGDSTAALLEIRIPDGVVLRRWSLAPGSHVLGDVAIGPTGDVIISDSGEPALYRLARGADSLEAFRLPLFRSLQGIAPTRDPNVVYVADYSHGILRLDLANGAASRVAEATATTTLGVDGLAWSDGALIAIQNGVAPPRVMRFELDASGERIVGAYVLERRADADEPTSGTLVGGEFFYVANSQWDKHTPAGQRRAGVRLTRPLIVSVPSARPPGSP